jgi:tetratricopeptide (TPR) repeat protein
MAAFDKAIDIDPRYAPAYVNRGSARQLKVDFSGAIADFDRSVGINLRASRSIQQSRGCGER